ncbi:ATP-binding protein [Larkinella bovis]|uniref:histidine kinase n=1 Tax=Larkinella bovis TaxID=683041 RepID=A0ABW0I9J8_9BACT
MKNVPVTPNNVRWPGGFFSSFIIQGAFLLICWLAFLPTGFAQQPWPPVFEFKTDSARITVDSTHYQVLEDLTQKLTFEQVRRSPDFRYDTPSDPKRTAHVCWVRFRVRNSLPHALDLYSLNFYASYLDLYWQDSTQRWHHQKTGDLVPENQISDRHGSKERARLFLHLKPGEQLTLYQRLETAYWHPAMSEVQPQFQTEQNRFHAFYQSTWVEKGWKLDYFDGIMIGILLLAVCYNLLIFVSIRDTVYLYFAICLLFFTLDRNQYGIQQAFLPNQPYLFKLAGNFFFTVFFFFFIQSILKFIQARLELRRLNLAITFFLIVSLGVNIIQFFIFRFPGSSPYGFQFGMEILIRVIYILTTIAVVKKIRRGSSDARFALLATLPLFSYWLFTLSTHLFGRYFGLKLSQSFRAAMPYVEGFCFAWLIISFSGALFNRYNLARKRVAQQAIEKEQLEKEREIERNRIIASQNERLEQQVKERTAQLQTSLEELKAAQNQLIQQEKLASLGELTAGIAHEIQNPLNFVNNFSDVSAELVSELEDERQKPDRDTELEQELLGDLKQNLQKISHHGRRASQIVRSMLAHSRTSAGERQPTHLNGLCDEYLRLAYHGLRAKDNTFNCELITDFDARIGLVNIVPQEMGRVLLNLFNNAFYTVQEKQKTASEPYKPVVSVQTKAGDRRIEIRVIDNGMGMPALVQEKVFQPFFTTKPTGEGTGLGLSLSYDIVTKGHNGTLTVTSQPGNGTEFVITLPVT